MKDKELLKILTNGEYDMDPTYKTMLKKKVLSNHEKLQKYNLITKGNMKNKFRFLIAGTGILSVVLIVAGMGILYKPNEKNELIKNKSKDDVNVVADESQSQELNDILLKVLQNNVSTSNAPISASNKSMLTDTEASKYSILNINYSYTKTTYEVGPQISKCRIGALQHGINYTDEVYNYFDGTYDLTSKYKAQSEDGVLLKYELYNEDSDNRYVYNYWGGDYIVKYQYPRVDSMPYAPPGYKEGTLTTEDVLNSYGIDVKLVDTVNIEGQKYYIIEWKQKKSNICWEYYFAKDKINDSTGDEMLTTRSWITDGKFSYYMHEYYVGEVSDTNLVGREKFEQENKYVTWEDVMKTFENEYKNVPIKTLRSVTVPNTDDKRKYLSDYKYLPLIPEGYDDIFYMVFPIREATGQYKLESDVICSENFFPRTDVGGRIYREYCSYWIRDREYAVGADSLYSFGFSTTTETNNEEDKPWIVISLDSFSKDVKDLDIIYNVSSDPRDVDYDSKKYPQNLGKTDIYIDSKLIRGNVYLNSTSCGCYEENKQAGEVIIIFVYDDFKFALVSNKYQNISSFKLTDIPKFSLKSYNTQNKTDMDKFMEYKDEIQIGGDYGDGGRTIYVLE